MTVFYCKPCGAMRVWPEGFARSFGPCEICARHASCADVPSRHLPIPPDKLIMPTTACIPTHPARGDALDPRTLLGKAVASVHGQTVKPAGGISLAVDTEGEGAAATRQRALNGVETTYVSFIDSDDQWYPHHLETHWRILLEHDADVAYSWFDGVNPFPQHRGRPFRNEDPHHITMTITVRTELMKQVGFRPHDHANPDWPGEDWRAIQELAKLGAKFIGTGEITWRYHGHGGNTSGLAGRGDAL